MISLDNSLVDLIVKGKISKDEGVLKANNPTYVKRKVEEVESVPGEPTK